MSARIVTGLNLKGGSGKSIISMYLVGTLARRGSRVLVCDADPQGTSLRLALSADESKPFPAAVAVAEYDGLLDFAAPPESGAPRGSGAMKHDSEGKDTNAPDAGAPAALGSILRRIAAQFRAGHPSADEAAVRERVLEFVVHEGWALDEATVDEALEGE